MIIKIQVFETKGDESPTQQMVAENWFDAEAYFYMLKRHNENKSDIIEVVDDTPF